MHVQAVQKKHGRLACRVQNATRAGTIHPVGNITLREVSNPEPKIVGCYVCMCIYILRTRGTSAPLLLYYFCHVTFGQAVATSSDTWEWPKSLHKKYSHHSQQTHDLYVVCSLVSDFQRLVQLVIASMRLLLLQI